MQNNERNIVERELAGKHGLDYEERPGFFPFKVQADRIMTALEKARADTAVQNLCDNPATANESSIGCEAGARAAAMRPEALIHKLAKWQFVAMTDWIKNSGGTSTEWDKCRQETRDTFVSWASRALDFIREHEFSAPAPLTPAQARHYISNFAKHIVPGTEYVDFPSGRIHLNNMTDDQAVKVAIGLMEIEAQADKGTRQ
jgi:hypothetical protein